MWRKKFYRPAPAVFILTYFQYDLVVLLFKLFHWILEKLFP